MQQIELYTIYEKPADHPGDYVLRRSVLQKINGIMQAVADPEPILVNPSLDEVRKALPDIGLTNIGRMVADDPIIYEVWI